MTDMLFYDENGALQRAVVDGRERSIVDGAIHPSDTSAEGLRVHAAELRWRRETGGITVLGMPVPTDDRAKVLLMGAAGSMTDEATAPFVAGALSVVLTGAQFKQLYAAMTAHVQDAFSRQATALAGIAAGTITTRAAVQAIFDAP